MPLINTLSLLSPIYACLFFVLIFATSASDNKGPKTILCSFMLLTSIVHVYAFTISNGNSIFSSYIDGIFAASFLSLTPFFYFYILSLTSENFSLKREMHHLVPSFIFLIVISVLHLFLSENEKVYYITKHMMGDFSENKLMKAIYFFSRAKGYVFAIQTVVYFILSVKKLSKHNETINNLFTRNESMKLNWLYVFSILYFFGSVNGTLIILIPLKEVFAHKFIFNTSLIIFAISYFVYGLLGLRQKPLMQIIRELDLSFKESSEPIEKPHELLISINNYILKHEVFLNPELKIWDIAKEVHSNRTYVSNVINENTGMNFTNYINSFRINKACSYLSEPDSNYLVEDLAILCGFNSLSSFNRAFRQHAGATPSVFRKNIDLGK